MQNYISMVAFSSSAYLWEAPLRTEVDDPLPPPGRLHRALQAQLGLPGAALSYHLDILHVVIQLCLVYYTTLAPHPSTHLRKGAPPEPAFEGVV